MKRYRVKLVRQVSQYCVVSLDADNGIQATDHAIANPDGDLRDWQEQSASETYYQSVKEMVPEPESKEKNITTKIYTYDVELDLSYDGADLVSSCFVSKVRDGTEYCSSLALLSDQGTIEGDNWGDVIQVPEQIIKKIYGWAEANGY